MATAGPVPAGAGWAFEFKWDGVRAVTSVGGGRVHVISRNNNDVTRTYPELAALTGLLDDHAVVLDGEIVARPILTVTATMDHRYLDGAHAARLGRSVREYLENPAVFEQLSTRDTVEERAYE
jgi:hypothetical protein